MVVIKMLYFPIHIPCFYNLQYSKIVPPFYCWRIGDMVCFFRMKLKNISCENIRDLIPFSWLAGLFFGICGGWFLTEPVALLDYSVVLCSDYSVFTAMMMRFLPVLLAILLAYFSKSFLLLFVIFFEAFLFSSVGTSFLLNLNSSAWLICFLMLFGKIFAFPALFFIWYRLASDHGDFLFQKGLISLAVIFALSCVDFAYISPFLNKLTFFMKG